MRKRNQPVDGRLNEIDHRISGIFIVFGYVFPHSVKVDRPAPENLIW